MRAFGGPKARRAAMSGITVSGITVAVLFHGMNSQMWVTGMNAVKAKPRYRTAAREPDE
jgi:hypothetical protein